jgi:hypothetical protein
MEVEIDLKKKFELIEYKKFYNSIDNGILLDKSIQEKEFVGKIFGDKFDELNEFRIRHIAELIGNIVKDYLELIELIENEFEEFVSRK